MGIRILSGVIAPSDTTHGTATIVFENHALSGDVRNSGPDQNRITNGAAGPFLEKPAFTVAIREFKVVETADSRVPGPRYLRESLPETDEFTIWTSVKDTHLTVGWRTKNSAPDSVYSSMSEIIEMHYMIIGET